MMIGWYVGLVGIVVGIAGGIFFFNSLSRLSGELKKSMHLLVIASLVYILFSSIMILFGIIKHDIKNVWWQIVPVFYFVSSVFYAVGSVRLVRLLENIQENQK